MVEVVSDIVHCIEHGGQTQCSGKDGRASLELATAFLQVSSIRAQSVLAHNRARSATDNSFPVRCYDAASTGSHPDLANTSSEMNLDHGGDFHTWLIEPLPI